MAALNPPRVLPGLGRTIVNFLLETRRAWTEEELLEVFKPAGLNDGATAHHGVTNTMSAFRAIGILATKSGEVMVTEEVAALGPKLSITTFRRALQTHVFDLERDGDPWQTQIGDAHTGGARDLNRALSWLLAQDALGRPLTWTGTGNIQGTQRKQFKTPDNELWAITNDVRWGATSRWALVLGLATPSALQKVSGLTPLPVVAINDVLDELPAERTPIAEFLTRLGSKVPVLAGGAVRTGLVAHLGSDPDPGIAADCSDSSVGQALRILEDRGRLSFETLPDAPGVRLSRFDNNRQTHVTLKRGGKR